jgi:preprotein translocase subunit SecE
MASFQGAKTFVEECLAELQKVTWPDYEQARNATWVIIVFVLLISGVIWIMDWGSRNLIDLIMGIFGA